jgi:hypothetical protein
MGLTHNRVALFDCVLVGLSAKCGSVEAVSARFKAFGVIVQTVRISMGESPRAPQSGY